MKMLGLFEALGEEDSDPGKVSGTPCWFMCLTHDI